MREEGINQMVQLPGNLQNGRMSHKSLLGKGGGVNESLRWCLPTLGALLLLLTYFFIDNCGSLCYFGNYLQDPRT